MLNFSHNGKRYEGWSADDARAAGVPPNTVGAAVKAEAAKDIAVLVNGWRAQVASTSPGKLMEWLFKSQIAADPASAAPEELTLIDREAAARGMDRDALLALIAAKASAYRQTALLIGVLEAEAKAAIDAIAADAASIETQIATILRDASSQAETALAEAAALINGGS